MAKIKELHLWLDIDGYDGTYPDGTCLDICETMADTVRIINSTGSGRVHTTQIQFLDFDIADRLFVHVYGDMIEIKEPLVAALCRSYATPTVKMLDDYSNDDYSRIIYNILKKYDGMVYKRDE